jgi:outer membrane protein OmpA-like peptidoglycan-associated protein
MIKKLFSVVLMVCLVVGTVGSAGAFVEADFSPHYGSKSPECFMSLDYTLSPSAPDVWVITKAGAEVGRAYIRTDGKLWREHSQGCTEVIPCCNPGTVSPIWYCPEVKEPEIVVLQEPEQVAPTSFVIYFDFNEDVIREDQEVVLQSLVDYLKGRGYNEVRLTAFCDYRGSDVYNMDLGQRRAYAVQHWLIKNGLDATTFSVINHGDRLSPDRIMKGKFCADCWSDRKVEINVE